MNLSAALAQDVERNLDSLNWEGSFEDYLNLVTENANLCERSASRVFRMIQSAGTDVAPDGKTYTYRFFENDIFGLEPQKAKLVDYFRAGAAGMEIAKRILLLMGPPGGGKSATISLLKKGLARWTRTQEGAVYAIKGCPVHEDPLHLLSPDMREVMRKEYGVKIDGELCPLCQFRLKAPDDPNLPEDERGWGGDPRKASVVRITMSEAERRGVGAFVPSDPKSQDIAELIGSMNLATVGTYGSSSDPRAYKFDGELNITNRGLMELVEALKIDEKFLYVLLPVNQEGLVKCPGHPLLSVDVVVVASTNEAEFNSFMSNPKNEALRDRMHIILFPYNLKVSDETRIYERMVSEAAFKSVHLAPGTLKYAAMLAVMTRLDPNAKLGDKVVTLMDKCRLYDGENVADVTKSQLKEIQEASKREGMGGLSPRFIIDAIGGALGQPNVKCVHPLNALSSLMEAVKTSPKVSDKDREPYQNMIAEVRKRFDTDIARIASQACVTGFADQAQMMVDRYVAEIEAWKAKDKLEDPITNELRDPDEKYMRAIEEIIRVGEMAKREFREEILFQAGRLGRQGKKFGWDSNPRLKEAIEKRLFSDVKNILKGLVATAGAQDEQQQKRIQSAVEAMKREGYCETCAKELLQYAGKLLDI